MLWQLTRRALRLLAVLWAVSALSFMLIELIPGDPVTNIYGDVATPEQIAHIRSQLGLDRPLADRYFTWLGGALTFDFGETLVPPITPISSIMLAALPVTLQLATMALLMGLLFGIPLGAIAAYYEGSLIDRIISGVSFAILSVPSFVLGLIISYLFVFNANAMRLAFLAIGLTATAVPLANRIRRRDANGWLSLLFPLIPAALGIALYFCMPAFPRQGWVTPRESLSLNLWHAFLPALTMSFGLIPLYAQLLRSDMQATLRQNFIVMARAKGSTPYQIVVREALRPSLFSLITVAALSFGTLLAGSVVVESIFNLPGLGRTVVRAINLSDYPVVQTGVLIAACVFVLLNMLVDVTYTLLDPRVRRAGR